MDQHISLSQVLRGHYACYGLPSNFRLMAARLRQVLNLWYRAQGRRSERGLTREQFASLVERFSAFASADR